MSEKLIFDGYDVRQEHIVVKAVNSGSGGREAVQYMVEAANAYPKLMAVVEAAKDFLTSDGDYFSWTEDERQCLSRLKETLLALGEEV
jgi:hypothetical protein